MLPLEVSHVQQFLLVFFRMGGIFVTAPVFGSASIPVPVKIWLSFLMAVLVYPMVDAAAIELNPNLGAYTFAVAAELAVGIVIGLAAQVLFVAVQMGGLVIGQEMGLTLANVIDPVTNEQVSVIAQFKLLMAILIYLAVDGHHLLVRAAVGSFETIPLAGTAIDAPAALYLADHMVVEMLRTAMQIAAPALVALFLVTIALGFMARTVPEMNIFAVGFSVRLLLGFIVVALAIPVFRWVFMKAHEQNAFDVFRMVELMGG